MNPNITIFSEQIFVFNVTLTPEQEANIGRALDVLEHLYLTPFDFVLIDAKSSSGFKYRCQLYEDPEIYLLSPQEVVETAEKPIGYTQGVLARTDLAFGIQEGFFLSDPLSEIMEKFKGYDSLLFIALENVDFRFPTRCL